MKISKKEKYNLKREKNTLKNRVKPICCVCIYTFIRDVIAFLQWLSVKSRTEFEVTVLLTYEALRGNLPPHRKELIVRIIVSQTVKCTARYCNGDMAQTLL